MIIVSCVPLLLDYLLNRFHIAEMPLSIAKTRKPHVLAEELILLASGAVTPIMLGDIAVCFYCQTAL
jgi:hypothetical protein